MKNKLSEILSKTRRFIEHNHTIVAPLSFMMRALGFFLLSALILNDFDLTGYTRSYLSKTILIYCLVSLGAFLFLQTRYNMVQVLEEYVPVFYWQLIGATLLFFPLMILGGQKEMFPWVTPLISAFLMGLWSSRHEWRQLLLKKPRVKNYYQLWRQLKPRWADRRPQQQANSDSVIAYDNVLISGAGTVLGHKILSLLATEHLKKLVLIDFNEQNLAMIRAWVKKFFPQVQAVFILSEDLTASSLKSLFKAYSIKYVFDLDRSFTHCHIEGAHKALLHRNLSFPRLLLDQAVTSKAKMVASLSAIPLDADEALTTAQSIVECYAQRLDSEKTRVVPFRVRALAEGQEAQSSLMAHFWGQDKSNVYLAPVKLVAPTLLTVIKQLIENPAHHGAVWEVTHVCEIKKLKLQREITLMDSLEDSAHKIQATIRSIKPSTLASEFLFPTSQEGAAIVANCPILETDFDKCFKDLETVMLTNPEGGQLKKLVAK
ncbi:MAG: polysaccharide biosynthesis protein [Candidatus Paracaedibacteraceae bacterium]|nr:polysaccharide biosynthesis protein [Candidatus Paracaedibacteraceae bacterium]